VSEFTTVSERDVSERQAGRQAGRKREGRAGGQGKRGKGGGAETTPQTSASRSQLTKIRSMGPVEKRGGKN